MATKRPRDRAPAQPRTSAPPAAPDLPAWLPAGFRPYRSGVVGGAGGPRVTVRTWTDGRAWLKVRATGDWPGGRLFGDLGPLVRPLALGAGVAYASEDGGRVAVHGDAVDFVVGRVCDHLGVTHRLFERWGEIRRK